MISSNIYSPIIVELLEELAMKGTEHISTTMEHLYNELMKVEREAHIQAHPYERSDQRMGYANGFKDRSMQTRFGNLKLKVPQVREGDFYPNCLEKGQRSEKALGLAVAEMYVQGVSTRRVKKITEELCGMQVSSTQVSRLAAQLDEDLSTFRERELTKAYPYLYLDARYEKVRHQGHVRGLAVLVAVGVREDGYREILGVSVSLSEAEVHWRTFLQDLQRRGLHGVKLIISDKHEGLAAAREATFSHVLWQRCLFHLAQNAQSHIPSKALREELSQKVREIYQATGLKEAKERFRSLIKQYEDTAKDFCEWLEENYEEGLTFFSFPGDHWKKLRTNNLLERLNQEIKRRTRVARLFPNKASCLRLVTAVCSEVNDEWQTGRRYMTF